MYKIFVLLFFLLIAVKNTFSQQNPKRGLRGAWIATFSNIDWPIRTQTPTQQKNAFVNLLDNLKNAGINTVFVQVRSQCDAMYASSIEPWSADLTGVQGQAPSPFWDPMVFMIEECHKRNIEFHAWLNPYRAISNFAGINNFAANHIARQRPEWLLTSGVLRTLDPGLPAVRNYILDVVKDIVTRYDIDGLHFDDYFYPNSAFDDNSTFASNARGFTDKADWRRDNVNLMVQSVNDAIKLIKPWVKFGISPSGIYRNSTNPTIGTPTSGLEHYTTLFADSKKWIEQGWVDYLAPQVYYFIGQSGADFSLVVPWWNNQANNRHMYIGVAGYKVNDFSLGQPAWLSPTQIPEQIRFSRNYNNLHGQIFYNTKSLMNNQLNFRDSLQQRLYNKPALVPNMPWKDNVKPNSPRNLTAAKYAKDSLVLTWLADNVLTGELNIAKKYVIYKSLTMPINTNNPDNILAIIPANATKFVDLNLDNNNYNFAVTALDRLSNESDLSNSVSTLTSSIDDDFTLASNILLYPNPTKAQFYIKLNDKIKGVVVVKIYNVQGALVHSWTQKVNGNSDIKVDMLNEIEIGTYLVEIKSINNVFRRKILIN
jgi:uncharacterized lipoprotein YddW (UPF0748 family)